MEDKSEKHEETLEEAVERRYGVLEEFLKHAKMDTKKKRAKKPKGLSKKEKRRRRAQRKGRR
jgi:hypothetical protein